MQTRQADLKQLSFAYNQYKKEHRDEHPKAFMKEHEKEPWFMERYNPMTVHQIKLAQRELATKKAKKFIEAIPIPSLDLTKRDNVEMSGEQP